jgi:hypothetical protein
MNALLCKPFYINALAAAIEIDSDPHVSLAATAYQAMAHSRESEWEAKEKKSEGGASYRSLLKMLHSLNLDTQEVLLDYNVAEQLAKLVAEASSKNIAPPKIVIVSAAINHGKRLDKSSENMDEWKFVRKRQRSTRDEFDKELDIWDVEPSIQSGDIVYDLAFTTITIDSPTEGHSIAGVFCAGRPALYDSNQTKFHPLPVPCDWMSGKNRRAEVLRSKSSFMDKKDDDLTVDMDVLVYISREYAKGVKPVQTLVNGQIEYNICPPIDDPQAGVGGGRARAPSLPLFGARRRRSRRRSRRMSRSKAASRRRKSRKSPRTQHNP